jgi:hypothetical protein
MSKKKLAGTIIACTIVIVVAIVLFTFKPWEGTTPPETYRLTTIVSPSGAGSVSPSGGEYQPGDQITLTANPASGYTFDYWSGDVLRTSSTVTITMDWDKSVTANFKTTTIPSSVSPSDCRCYSYTLKRYIPCEQATAICRDGTCSISASRSGTCSHHGGVARWIN